MERKATRQRRYSPRAPLGRKFYEERVFHKPPSSLPEKRSVFSTDSPALHGTALPKSRRDAPADAGVSGGQKQPWWLAWRRT